MKKEKTYCIFVKDFEPFFYILVPDNVGKREMLLNFKQLYKDAGRRNV